jgi:hypothetical protein
LVTLAIQAALNSLLGCVEAEIRPKDKRSKIIPKYFIVHPQADLIISYFISLHASPFA